MKKLSDLRVGQKLVLLAIVFLVPTLAVIVALFVIVKRISIDFAREEIEGVRTIRPIIEVVRTLQQRRALGQVMFRDPDSSVRETFSLKSEELRRRWSEVSSIADRGSRRAWLHARSRATGDSWAAIGQSLDHLDTLAADADLSTRFREENEIIGRVLMFMAEVADESNLTLDPDLDSYYLQAVLTRSAPDLIEDLTRARALTAAVLWPKGDEADARRRLGEMLILISEKQRRLEDSFDRSCAARPSLKETIGPGFRAVQEIGKRSLTQIESILAGDPQAIASAKAEYLSAATSRLDEVYAMKGPLADQLNALLVQRIDMRERQLWKAVAAAVGGMLVLAALCAGIIRDIRRPIAQLAATARAIADGQANLQVTIPTRGDEIGDLAEALHYMLQVEKTQRESLVENNVKLLEATERALAADRAKRDFLAAMSHEIRTPLNGILPVADLLADTRLDETQRQYLRTVRTSAEHLLTLVDDILDFSKIEAGRVELEQSQFALREVLGDSIQTLAARAADRGLELSLHVKPDVPDELIGDLHRLRQVVMNLVGNALKFTHEGEVSVLVECTDRRPGSVELRFKVRDTGIGISPEVLPRLFSAFEQADNSTTRQYGGSGLGLAISKRLVQLMHGDLAVESQVGQGSTFTFTARFGLADATGEAAAWNDLPAARVLSVDDNATNRMIVRDILTTWGLETAEAARGGEALEKLRAAHAEGKPYDLVITDMMMPDLDGFSLVEKIRADADLRDVRVIMLTSASRAEDAPRARQLGLSSVILKPIRQAQLMDAIAEAFGFQRRSKAAVAIDPARIPAQRPLHVLLVEDNATNQRVARLNLELWGHRVTAAADGVEAVERFDNDAFDLILMDTQMPGMNGLEATGAIRRREVGGRHVPIIAMTANVVKGFREECFAAGMDGYVTKPLRREVLVQEMARLIPDLIQAELPAPATALAPIAPVNETAPFDRDGFLASLGGNPAMMKEVLTITLGEDVPRLAQALEDAKDAETFEQAAHAIKGMAAELRAEPCRAAAAALEESKSKDDVPLLRERLKELKEALENALGSVQ